MVPQSTLRPVRKCQWCGIKARAVSIWGECGDCAEERQAYEYEHDAPWQGPEVEYDYDA